MSNTASFPLPIVQYQIVNTSGKGAHFRRPGTLSFGARSPFPPYLALPQECQGRLGRIRCLGIVFDTSLLLECSSQGHGGISNAALKFFPSVGKSELSEEFNSSASDFLVGTQEGKKGKGFKKQKQNLQGKRKVHILVDGWTKKHPMHSHSDYKLTSAGRCIHPPRTAVAPD